MKNNKTINTEAHYYQEVTYDSVKEKWAALAALLMIPLFLVVLGVGLFSIFKLPTLDKTNGFEMGIGGGVDRYKGESLDYIQ